MEDNNNISTLHEVSTKVTQGDSSALEYNFLESSGDINIFQTKSPTSLEENELYKKVCIALDRCKNNQSTCVIEDFKQRYPDLEWSEVNEQTLNSITFQDSNEEFLPFKEQQQIFNSVDSIPLNYRKTPSQLSKEDLMATYEQMHRTSTLPKMLNPKPQIDEELNMSKKSGEFSFDVVLNEEAKKDWHAYLEQSSIKSVKSIDINEFISQLFIKFVKSLPRLQFGDSEVNELPQQKITENVLLDFVVTGDLASH